MKYFSELTVKEVFNNSLNYFCPIKIYINNTLIWDNDDEDINSSELYNWITSLDNLVYSIKIDIIFHHHSIIYLEIKDNG